MTSLAEFFNIKQGDKLKGVTHKNNTIKRNIIAYMAVNGECALSELTKELHISVPTITKLVQELIEDNIVNDLGKVETPGGRRPNVFGLANSAIYFVGVNVGRDNMTYVVTDLQNNIIKEVTDTSFELQNRPQCLEKICANIEDFVENCGVDRSKILGVGVSIVGRVNPETGRSYAYFTSSEESLRDIIQERIKIRVLLENDTRARCYAEYNFNRSKEENDIIYLHLGRGVAIGIVIDGKLYYGKNGFAGEFGHIPFFDNETICACGKKGCLETEVSGIAIEEKFVKLVKKGVNTILRDKFDRGEQIHINDIIAAAQNDDNLSIELIEEVGEKLGKAVAFLINTFNPETIIVGGNLAAAGDYIMLPLKASTNKYSLNLVYKDTKFRKSKMSENACAWGVAMLIHNKIIVCRWSITLVSCYRSIRINCII
jgi:predicted NBD/HSP70 family sugar kinase